MAQPAAQAKVLRIALIMDGKIVHDKIIRLGDDVTVGKGAKSSFVIEQASLPKDEFPLFVHSKGKYFLQFTEAMKGKVDRGNNLVVALSKLRADPTVEKVGTSWKLELSERDKGKVSLDNYDILFQFVSAPIAPPVRPQRVDFRPRLIHEDDGVLFVFLALFTFINLVFVVWVWNTEVVEITSIEQLDEKWTRLPVQPPKPEVPVEATPDEGPCEDTKPKEDKPKEEKVSEKPADAAPKSDAERKAEAMSKVRERSSALKIAGTRGQAASGAGTSRDWGAQLNSRGGSNGGPMVVNDEGTRGGGDKPGEDRAGGEVKGVGGGVTSVGEAEGVKIKSELVVEEGRIDDADPTVQGAIKQTIAKYQGQLKYCYDQRLKLKSDLQGRVEVEWMVSKGRVTSVSVFANTTGDDEFADCITGKIKRWIFPPEIEQEVSFPFLFRAKG